MKTFIYGGSFNPPTIAHLSIAEHLSKYGKVIFTITNEHAFGKELLPIETRHYLLQKSIVEKYMYDVKIMGKYMYDFLKSLPEKEEYIIVVGSDNLKDLYKWYKFKELLEQYSFLIIPRTTNISSTLVREKCQKKEDITELVPSIIKKDILNFYR
jgi:nicotinic acid mononucleotide adenylyltransferase